VRKPEPPEPPNPAEPASAAPSASTPRQHQPSGAAASGKLAGLGQALRWLRERQGRKQYQVADRAGITKGMLSAYETGRQRPSLETLEKLLETLECDLNDLHNAIQIVNGRPEALRAWQGWQGERRPRHGTKEVGLLGGLGGISGAGGAHFLHAAVPGSAGSATAGSPGSSGGAAGGAVPDIYSGWDVYPGSLPEASAIGEGSGPGEARPGGDSSSRLYDVIGRTLPLPPEEEKALSQILQGFHDLIRYWHKALVEIRSQGPVPG
jgi:transcriptional regulator with XRE-family HTH domain